MRICCRMLAEKELRSRLERAAEAAMSIALHQASPLARLFSRELCDASAQLRFIHTTEL